MIFQAEKNDELEEADTNSDVSQIKINHYFHHYFLSDIYMVVHHNQLVAVWSPSPIKSCYLGAKVWGLLFAH